jgi:hypothetical protein
LTVPQAGGVLNEGGWSRVGYLTGNG